MLVKFETVIGDPLEDYEKKQSEKMERLTGASEESDFFNTHGTLSTTYVDMMDVKSFDVGYVYHNSERKRCVYAKLASDGTWTRNLLTSGENFAKIIEIVQNVKIHSSEVLLESYEHYN